jgi:predicted NAD/FAD-binding protein
MHGYRKLCCRAAPDLLEQTMKVLILGSGVIGTTMAYYLAQRRP